MVVWCSLVFEVIPLSGDSSRTGPYCASPVAYPILHSPIECEPTAIEIQSRLDGFPLVVHVVIDSMVDCNEMSIAANPPFLNYFGSVKTCQLARTLT